MIQIEGKTVTLVNVQRGKDQQNSVFIIDRSMSEWWEFGINKRTWGINMPHFPRCEFPLIDVSYLPLHIRDNLLNDADLSCKEGIARLIKQLIAAGATGYLLGGEKEKAAIFDEGGFRGKTVERTTI